MRATRVAALLAAPLWALGLVTAGPGMAAAAQPIDTGSGDASSDIAELPAWPEDAAEDGTLSGLSERIRREVDILIRDTLTSAVEPAPPWNQGDDPWDAEHGNWVWDGEWTGDREWERAAPPAQAPFPVAVPTAGLPVADGAAELPVAPLSTAPVGQPPAGVEAEPAESVPAPSPDAAPVAPAAVDAEPRFLTALTASPPAIARTAETDAGSPLGLLAILGALCVLGAAAVGRLAEPSAAALFRRDVRLALRTRRLHIPS